MPWCAGCDRFLSPSTVLVDGACPRCGAMVDPGRARSPDAPVAAPVAAPDAVPDAVPDAQTPPAPGTAPEAAPDDASVPLPWHFKALVAAIVFYLGWRAVQGIEWVARQF